MLTIGQIHLFGYMIEPEEAFAMQGIACQLFSFLRDHQVFESCVLHGIFLDCLQSFIDNIDDYIDPTVL